MTRLKRFAAVSLLIASISAIAVADGGSMQGPGSPAPPPPCTVGCPNTSSAEPAPHASIDPLVVANALVALIAKTIL